MYIIILLVFFLLKSGRVTEVLVVGVIESSLEHMVFPDSFDIIPKIL